MMKDEARLCSLLIFFQWKPVRFDDISTTDDPLAQSYLTRRLPRRPPPRHCTFGSRVVVVVVFVVFVVFVVVVCRARTL